MARPKTVKSGQKLNLYIPSAAKRVLFKLATEQRKSMSAVVTDLVLASQPKKEAA